VRIFEGQYGYLRANTDIRIFALKVNNQHWLLAIIGHAKTNTLQQNMFLRIYFRNLSVQRSFLQYKNQCLERVNVKYVINIFHIVSDINPRLITTLTLETVCKIYPRRWHLNGNSYSTRRIHLSYSVSIYLNFIPICWNVLIWNIVDTTPFSGGSVNI
jgi:hypothetical protein